MLNPKAFFITFAYSNQMTSMNKTEKQIAAAASRPTVTTTAPSWPPTASRPTCPSPKSLPASSPSTPISPNNNNYYKTTNTTDDEYSKANLEFY